MNSTDPTNRPSPLRDVAQSPEATARYLADVQRVLLEIGDNLELLARETRVHLRGTHLDGDHWGEARWRALPVERSLQSVLKRVHGLTADLEKTAFKRHAFSEKVNKLPKERQQKALEKARKKNPQIQAAQNSSPQAGQQDPGRGYSGPASIYDLGRNRESA
ncbi:hypothetical protein [Rhodococcus qingshengii]|uniref:hypothetical protein n=1 Tax=Rhodococcus qingshengii TaxID=334542 RepID=UPI0036F9FC9C